jgi:hypothetical protein
MRWVAGAVIGIALLSVGVIALVNAQGVPLRELQERCRVSKPAWNNYQEDIKGQIGAAPVAEWSGVPISARFEGETFHVTFSLQPPWLDYPCALPILLRDPMGNIYRSAVAEPGGEGERTYVFPIKASSAGLPWVEIHYPHHQTRLALDPSGTWRTQS